MSFHFCDLLCLSDGIQTDKIVQRRVSLMEGRGYQRTLAIFPSVHFIHQLVNILPSFFADVFLLLFVDCPMTHLTDIELWTILIFLILKPF